MQHNSFTVWAMMPPPELSDEELAKVGVSETSPRAALLKLLVEKRCPESYRRLKELKERVNAEKMHTDTSLDHRLAAGKVNRYLANLEATINAQMGRIASDVLKSVLVAEVDALVERWLLLRLAAAPKQEHVIKGMKVVGGIIKAKGAK